MIDKLKKFVKEYDLLILLFLAHASMLIFFHYSTIYSLNSMVEETRKLSEITLGIVNQTLK